MPFLGAHLSVTGGFTKAIDAAVALGCDTVQIFTGSPSQWHVTAMPGGWAGKPLDPAAVAAFRAATAKAGLRYPTAHDSYLINLAAPADDLFDKSVAAFADELYRADQLGLAYLVTHPGAHVGSGEPAGLARVVAGLNKAVAKHPNATTVVLLETTAGQGSSLGHRFEHLKYILDHVDEPHRFGVCLDTCHVFAAGYDLRTPAKYAATFAEFDRVVGLGRLKLFHVNDSVKPLGSRVDRHAGLGLGQIGEAAFKRLAADPRFADTPMILETPKEAADGTAMDPINLGKLRKFAARKRAG